MRFSSFIRSKHHKVENFDGPNQSSTVVLAASPPCLASLYCCDCCSRRCLIGQEEWDFVDSRYHESWWVDVGHQTSSLSDLWRHRWWSLWRRQVLAKALAALGAVLYLQRPSRSAEEGVNWNYAEQLLISRWLQFSLPLSSFSFSALCDEAE
jgi:hypothetical protein